MLPSSPSWAWLKGCGDIAAEPSRRQDAGCRQPTAHTNGLVPVRVFFAHWYFQYAQEASRKPPGMSEVKAQLSFKSLFWYACISVSPKQNTTQNLYSSFSVAIVGAALLCSWPLLFKRLQAQYADPWCQGSQQEHLAVSLRFEALRLLKNELLEPYYYNGLYRDNGKENGNFCSILGLYRDNGKENGNFCSILGLYRDNGSVFIGVFLYYLKRMARCLARRPPSISTSLSLAPISQGNLGVLISLMWS